MASTHTDTDTTSNRVTGRDRGNTEPTDHQVGVNNDLPDTRGSGSGGLGTAVYQSRSNPAANGENDDHQKHHEGEKGKGKRVRNWRQAADLMDELEREFELDDDGDFDDDIVVATSAADPFGKRKRSTPMRRNQTNRRITAGSAQQLQQHVDSSSGVHAGSSSGVHGEGGSGSMRTPQRQILRNRYHRELMKMVESSARDDGDVEEHDAASIGTNVDNEEEEETEGATRPKRRLIRHFSTPSPSKKKSPKKSPQKMTKEDEKKWDERKQKEVERMRKLFAQVDKMELIDAAKVNTTPKDRFLFL